MNNFPGVANSNLAQAQHHAQLAVNSADTAQQWCLRANTANWESPAAAIFSRWLAELVLTSRRAKSQTEDLIAAIRSV